MRVLPGNNGSNILAWLAGKYPDQVGQLFSERKENPRFFWEYALDNGVFGAWSRAGNDSWDAEAWSSRLEHYANLEQQPMWVLIPDAVGDRDLTLRRWERYSGFVKDLGFENLAFAYQDGMTPGDVPSETHTVFVGGSTEWKWNVVESACETFPNVHVGRVNTFSQMKRCAECGAKSTDGTGFGRGGLNTWKRLIDFLKWQNGELTIPEQLKLNIELKTN